MIHTDDNRSVMNSWANYRRIRHRGECKRTKKDLRFCIGSCCTDIEKRGPSAPPVARVLRISYRTAYDSTVLRSVSAGQRPGNNVCRRTKGRRYQPNRDHQTTNVEAVNKNVEKIRHFEHLGVRVRTFEQLILYLRI